MGDVALTPQIICGVCLVILGTWLYSAAGAGAGQAVFDALGQKEAFELEEMSIEPTLLASPKNLYNASGISPTGMSFMGSPKGTGILHIFDEGSDKPMESLPASSARDSYLPMQRYTGVLDNAGAELQEQYEEEEEERDNVEDVEQML